MAKQTIVVNLFAGPGAGKTTCAWEIASELKKRGYEAEYVSEYAKEFVWDNNMEMLDGSLKHQQMLYNEQLHRITRLLGKVDFIVTDSPTLLSAQYLKEPNEEFENKMIDDFKKNQNFNLFINRGKTYQQAGRLQNLQESRAIDNKIKQFLKDNNIYFGTYYHHTIDVVIDNIIKNFHKVNDKANKEIDNKQEKVVTEFSILQIPSEKREFLFKDIAMLENGIDDVDANNYTSVFSSHFDKIIDLNDREQVSDALEELFLKYNDCEDPNYKGRSLSVSDVVVLKSNTSEKAYYCNNFGWNTLPDKFVTDWNNKNNDINISDEHSKNDQTKDEIDFEY